MYKILKDQRASPDGCRVLNYTKGDQVSIGADFSESLAKIFLDKGWAEEVKAVSKPAPKVIKKSVKRK
jgi:hypothetical protein